jgi:hypothetical protein
MLRLFSLLPLRGLLRLEWLGFHGLTVPAGSPVPGRGVSALRALTCALPCCLTISHNQ